MTPAGYAPGGATIRFEIVSTTARLSEIGPAWTALWQGTDALVFQSHAWVEAWWRTAPDRDRRGLRIVLAWRGDGLCAVLPLATCRRRFVTLLEWAAKEHTDYGDALLAPDTGADIVDRMFAHVCRAGGFDLAYVNRLLPTAAARAILGRDAPAKDETGKIALRPSHRSEISFRVTGTGDGSWQSGKAWFDAQSKKTRQNYRRGQKFMAEKGELRFRLLSRDEPLAPVLERLALYKRKWLAGQALESALFDEGAPALAALVDVLARTGLLRAFVLECDGVMIAVSLNFVQGDTMMAFVTTYDPDFERGSPGTVLMMDYIQWSIDQKLTMVDFLCGGEPFKSRFATHSVTLDSVVGARTLIGHAALLADGLRHRLKQRRKPADASPSPDQAMAVAATTAS